MIMSKFGELLDLSPLATKIHRLTGKCNTKDCLNPSQYSHRLVKNDDLVLALAIGVWLYDTSESYNKQSVDLNAAMLGAMGLTNKKAPAVINRRLQNMKGVNPFIPVMLPSAEASEPDEEGKPKLENPLDFSWLIK